MIFLRNLLRSPLRSAMTIVGVATAVALSVAITTLTFDLQEQIDTISGQYRSEVLIREQRASSPMSSRIPAALMRQLLAEFGDDLSPMVIGNLNEAWSPYVLLVGAEPGFMRRVPLVQGQPVEAGRGQVAVGEIAAQRLGIGPGHRLQVGGDELQVTAVFRSGSRMFDGGVMTDIAQAQRALSRDASTAHYSLAALHVGHGQNTQEVVRRIQSRYPTLTAAPSHELSGSLRLVRVARAFVGTIAVIAAFSAAVVLVNTLLMSVSERTREIGILMTIGWTPSRVLRLLLAESLVLCTLGAMLGDLMALGILHVVNQMPSVGFGWIPIRISAQQVAMSWVATWGIAVLALAWPAFIVCRMQPWAALRHE